MKHIQMKNDDTENYSDFWLSPHAASTIDYGFDKKHK